MGKPYDSTSKYLIEGFPGDWLALAGLPVRGPVEVVDANLSTITAEADKVIRVGGSEPWLAHFELQAGRDARLGSRLLRYNALLDVRHDLPTRSVVVLLRPEADAPGLTGEYRRAVPGGLEYLTFRYGVLRVWEAPVGAFLAGGLGTLPLAPIADLGALPIEAVVAAVGRRIDQAPPELGGLLWTSTSILMGIRYPAEFIQILVRGARQMKESSFYQAILAEGEARGEIRGELNHARRTLIRIGERRFGPMRVLDQDKIVEIGTLERLEDLGDQAATAPVASWAEFWALVGGDDLA